MEQIENQKPKKQSIQTDRVTIGTKEAAKLESWILQVNEFLNGYTTISKSEIVNFLITSHKDALSSREIKRLTHANYNPVKHMQWLTKQLKDALEANDTEQVSKIQIELRKVELPKSEAKNESVNSKTHPTVSKPQRNRNKKLNKDSRERESITDEIQPASFINSESSNLEK